MSALEENRQVGSKKVGRIAGFEPGSHERDCRSFPNPFERMREVRTSVAKAFCGTPLAFPSNRMASGNRTQGGK
jgi:hypothetical protein